LAKFHGDVPEIEYHIAIHVYRDGPLNRLVTLGMNKFALPEVSVEHVADADTTVIGSLVNVVCQTLVDRGRLDAPGQLTVLVANKKAVVRLVPAQPREGDAENSLVALSFATPLFK
jgi:hypothetical protein